MKKKRFKIYPRDCKKCKKPKIMKIDGKEYPTKIVDLKVCKKCNDLEKCQASIIIRVHSRLGFSI